MSAKYFYLIIFLIIVAAVTRTDAVLTLVYLLVGVYAVGRWWSRRSLSHVRFTRAFTNRAFLGEKIPVKLELTNMGRLPVIWLRVRDLLPVGMGINQFQEVIHLGPRQRRRFEYQLQPTKRGYYQIGPLSLYSGDLLGLTDDQKREGVADHLTVYPRIVALTKPRLPSRTPIGSLRYAPPIYEDPNRVFGKRDYRVGDSLRRVDWKATAVLGRLQVKQFEPSISLETMILLNLNRAEYDSQRWIDATELAIVVAASMANWVVGEKQSVAFSTNGKDPLAAEGARIDVPMHKGRLHLMRVLDVLARVEAADTLECVALLRRERVRQAWGTTLIVVTGKVSDALFDELFAAQRSGLNTTLILCGFLSQVEEIKRRARQFGILVYHARTERDLEMWRQ